MTTHHATNFKNLVIGLLLIWSGELIAQKNTVSSGGEASGSGGSLSYSIGQIDYKSTNSSTGTVSEGVQQAFEIYHVGVSELTAHDLSINVYPNPSTDKVNLEVTGALSEGLSYKLYDANGKIIASEVIKNNTTTISMEGLSAAMYFIYVEENKNLIDSFKIIKND